MQISKLQTLSSHFIPLAVLFLKHSMITDLTSSFLHRIKPVRRVSAIISNCQNQGQATYFRDIVIV